jgi:hypothetical protein
MNHRICSCYALFAFATLTPPLSVVDANESSFYSVNRLNSHYVKVSLVEKDQFAAVEGEQLRDSLINEEISAFYWSEYQQVAGSFLKALGLEFGSKVTRLAVGGLEEEALSEMAIFPNLEYLELLSNDPFDPPLSDMPVFLACKKLVICFPLVGLTSMFYQIRFLKLQWLI